MRRTPFDQAVAAIRNGADYQLKGSMLEVNGVVLAITPEQFEIAWEATMEADGEDFVVRIAE